MQEPRGETLSESVDDRSGGPAASLRTDRAVKPTLLLFGLALAVLAADLISKVIVTETLPGEPPVRLLGGTVYLLHVRNTGAAFSLGTSYTYVLTAIAAVVVLVIARTARRLRSVGWAVSLGLVLGGATGNLVDRLFRSPGPLRGAVVDFISVFNAEGTGFPVFNLADSALCVGVTLAVLLELTGRRLGGGGRGERPARRR